MQDVWKFLEPHLAGAMVVLVPALVGLAMAWIKARTAKLEAQRQAALGAVCEVEAMTRPRVELDSEGKHAHARERVARRLPKGVRPSLEKLDELVVEAWKLEQRRPTSEPPSSDSTPTQPNRPPKFPDRNL